MRTINTDLIRAGSSADETVYSKEQVFQILYDNLIPVVDKGSDRILDSSKYVRLAKDYGYRHYRFLKYSDIADLGLSKSFTSYQKQFLSRNGAVIAIFNTLNNKPISIVFRSISQKEFMDFSLVHGVYGFDLMNPDFKYGDLIILTEGLYDADTLRQVYPNVVAVQTSIVNQSQADILQTMTDNFMIAFDSDDSGETGYVKAVMRLGLDTPKLEIFPGDKDVGIMEEKKDSPFEFSERQAFYKEQVDRRLLEVQDSMDFGFM